MPLRHFLRDDDVTHEEQAHILSRAARIKAAPFTDRSLVGPEVVAVLFDKQTLRTQLSFSAAIAHLGGYPMVVDGKLAQVGVRESIADDVSGLLVDEPHQLVDALGALLDDDALRTRLGDGSLAMSHQFTWQHAQESFSHVVAAVLRGERVDAQDPDAE